MSANYKIVQIRVARVAQGLQRLQKKPTAESVHALRVATRRLRAVLSLCCVKQSEYQRAQIFLKKLTKYLGKVRTLDVCRNILSQVSRSLHKQACSRYTQHICQQWLKIRQHKAVALWHFGSKKREAQRLKQLTGRLPATHDEDYLKTTVAYAHRRLVRQLGYRKKRFSKQALHACRIALKQFRYATEALAVGTGRNLNPAIQRLRQVQTALGDLHDVEVVIRRLNQHTQKHKAAHSKKEAMVLRAQLKKQEAILRQAANRSLMRLRQELG